MSFPGNVQALRDLSLRVARGSALALIGESGAGKSTAVAAIAGLLPRGATARGQVLLAGEDLGRLDPGQWRGRRVATLFQDTGDALDPTMTVGAQIAEVCRLRLGLGRAEARGRALHALGRVGLTDVGRIASAFAHQLSGGQRRRALLAVALAAEPELLLADEPTAGLDGTSAAQVAEQLGALTGHGMGLLLVTHELGLVARLARQALVLYGGTVLEEGAAPELLLRPRHPYTRALLRAVPPGPGRATEPPRPLPGRGPGPSEPGCPFAARCPEVLPVCRHQRPPAFATPDAPTHLVHCWQRETPGAPVGQGAP